MTTRTPRARRKPTPTPCSLALAGPQTLREATSTYAMLRQSLADHEAVALDCTEVSAVDLSFVQLLLSARQSAAAAGRRFVLQPPPQGALLDALRRGGVLNADADPARWMTAGETP